jgi:hypothetical protein
MTETTETSGSAFPLELHQAAGLLGSYCAVERRLFEVTGSLSTKPEMLPEIQVFLDSISAQHAWHAELWADRLPIVSGLDARALVALPSPLDEIFELVAAGGQLEAMAGLFRVVIPRLITSYLRHRALASAASEAPTRRTLRLVLRDEVEAWVSGEALVLDLLGSAEAVAVAGHGAISLEARLVEGGVFPGLVRWPGHRA